MIATLTDGATAALAILSIAIKLIIGGAVLLMAARGAEVTLHEHSQRPVPSMVSPSHSPESVLVGVHVDRFNRYR